MNENVCRACRRYQGRLENGLSRGWLCAREVYMQESDVVPGFSFLKKDKLHPMTSERAEYPEWCERPLEQVILASGDECGLRPDDEEKMRHDGNRVASHKLERIAVVR